MDLHSLLRPRSIAVIGASPRSFVGHIALRNCQALGFRGPLTPVNPRYPDIAGFPAVPALADCPEPPELALVQLATDRVLPAIQDAVAAGTRRFVVPGAGFTDSGTAATRLAEDLARLAASDGIQVVGPNCMGVLDLVTGAAPYIGTAANVRRGSVAVIAHSGAIAEAFVNAGGRVPLSTVVSAGAEATTTAADYLRFFAADEHTTAVCAFLEGFADADDLLAAARDLAAAGKQLAVCLVGRSSTAQAGITAHSGKLAPSSRVATAALRQAGAAVAHDLDELLAIGEILGTGRRVPGRRTHVVTNSGGEANLIADLAADAGLDLPPLTESTHEELRARWPRFHAANPLDPWGADDYQNIYPTAITAVAGEPGDMLILAQDQQASAGEHEHTLARDLAGYLADSTRDGATLPVVLSPTSDRPDPAVETFCRERRIPLLRGARPALNALASLAATRVTSPTSPCYRRHPRMSDTAPLTENEAMDVLAAYGLPTPHRIVATTPDEAADAAAELDGPIVLKCLAPTLWHKTELGLLRIGLRSPDEVRHAAKEMLAAGHDAGYDCTLLIAEQVSGPLEVLLGYKRDPVFGPTVLFGLGGIWTEFHDDVALHAGPLDEHAARELITTHRAGHMITHARAGALHLDSVITALCAVSDAGTAHPEITAIDVNPLIVSRDRAVAVDALIHTDSVSAEGETR